MCKVPFEAKRATAKYCSRRCSVRASRAGVAGSRCIEPQAAGDAVESSTMAELAEVGRVDSPAGQCAIVLAKRIDTGRESGAGLAALVREHRAALAAAMKDGEPGFSPVDMLRERRQRLLVDDLFGYGDDPGA